MSKFKLWITLGNDAMQTGEDVANALRKVAGKIDSIDVLEAFHYQNILDTNGNVVGAYAVKRD